MNMIKLQRWLQENRILWGSGLIAIILLGVIISGYGSPPGWTGLTYYEEISYPAPDRIVSIRTAWDWSELLFIPLILIFVTVWLNRSAKQRDRVRQDIQNSYQTLQSYMDLITELIKDGKFEDPSAERIANLVVSRTLTTFETLDPRHKAFLLSFLKTSGFIRREDPIVSLQDANLREAVIQHIDLADTDLSGADFRRAEFINVKFGGANLANADLRRAKMFNCQLAGANWTGALTYGMKLTPFSQREKEILAPSNPNIPE